MCIVNRDYVEHVPTCLDLGKDFRPTDEISSHFVNNYFVFVAMVTLHNILCTDVE